MIGVILAGGYAKRLYPLTENIPKALLPVVGKPIIHYILEQLFFMDKIILSTNRRFEKHFRNYLDICGLSERVDIVVENSTTESNKLGAIGALENLVDGIDDDVLIVAGDNIFDFSISDMLEDFIDDKRVIIGAYDLDDLEVAKRFGCFSLDDGGRIIDFVEKPAEPVSGIISTGIYMIPSGGLKYIAEYMAEGNNADAPGYFMQWLILKTDVYAHVFSGRWFDIGQFDQYNEAIDYFAGKK